MDADTDFDGNTDWYNAGYGDSRYYGDGRGNYSGNFQNQSNGYGYNPYQGGYGAPQQYQAPQMQNNAWMQQMQEQRAAALAEQQKAMQEARARFEAARAEAQKQYQERMAAAKAKADATAQQPAPKQ